MRFRDKYRDVEDTIPDPPTLMSVLARRQTQPTQPLVRPNESNGIPDPPSLEMTIRERNARGGRHDR